MAQIFNFADEVARRSPAVPPAPSVGVLDLFDDESGGVGIDACLSSEAMASTEMLRRLIGATYFDLSSTDGKMYSVNGALPASDVAALTEAAESCGVVVHDSRLSRSA